MRSENSFFSFSNASMKEDLRRFRIIPVITILAYFGFAILPVLINYHSWEYINSYMERVLLNQSLSMNIIHVAAATGISCALFSYLHGTASCVDKHSKPVTRSGLFWSSFVSGIIMIIIPILITGILMFCVSGASVSPDWLANLTANGDVPDIAAKASVDILTLPRIATWMAHSLLLSFYAFAFANLAGILSGLNIIHPLFAMFLLWAPCLIDLIIELLKETFLFGYWGWQDEFAMKLSPFLYLMENPFGKETIAATLIYLAIGIAVTLLTVAIYRGIKLEREKNSLVVPVIADILVIILTFMAATTLGLLVTELGFGLESGKELPFILVVIALSLVFFPLFRMIADGSTRIFRPRFFVNLIIYAAVAALCFSLTVFDVAGFENKVPDSADVASVEIQSGYTAADPLTLEGPESIKLAADLHQSIVDNKYLAEHPYSTAEISPLSNYSVIYTLKNGKIIARNYSSVPVELEDAYAALYESEEFRTKDQLDTAAIEKALKNLAIRYEAWLQDPNNPEWGSYESSNVKKDDILPLTEAINADLRNRKFRDVAFTTDDPVNSFQFDYEDLYPNGSDVPGLPNYYHVNVLDGDANIKAFIESHPYLEDWTESGGYGPA